MSPYMYQMLYSPWFAPVVGVTICACVVGFGYLLISRSRSEPVRRRFPTVEYGRESKANTDDGSRSFGERRNGLRRSGSSIRVRVADAEYHEIGMAWVMDRSTGGIGLYMEEPLEPGTVVRVRPEGAGDVAGWIPVTVRSCQKGEADFWKLGCQFERTPPWSVLLLFG